jgi:hypothetical protein
VTPPRRSVTLPTRIRYQAIRGLRAARRWRGHRPPGPGSPPSVPEGWVVGPPDFVGIGAQKAGTSWWSALIHEHPDVHRSGGQPKELHFFDAYWERSFGDPDAERYARYFPRPGDGGVSGEWTPGYMVDFWTPTLIRRAAPQARILVMLRDPIERYRSSMSHTDEMSRSPLGRLDAMGAFQRGLYAQQLHRVFQAFPVGQVLVLQYERCRADPAGELARTIDFLGWRPFQPDPGVFGRQVNPTTGRKLELTPELRASLAAAYAPDLARLPALAPEIDLDLWPTMREGRIG